MDGVQKLFKSRIAIQTVCFDNGRQRVVDVVQGLGYTVDGISALLRQGLAFSGKRRVDGI